MFQLLTVEETSGSAIHYWLVFLVVWFNFEWLCCSYFIKSLSLETLSLNSLPFIAGQAKLDGFSLSLLV